MLESQPSRAAGGLVLGEPAYRAQTPWGPGWAVLAAALITLVGILATIFFVGAANLNPPPGTESPVMHGHVALSTLGVWQAATIALTLLASLLFGGRLGEVLALKAPVAGPLVYLSAIGAMVVLQVIVSIVQYFLVSGDMFADLRPFVDVAAGPNWGLALLVVGIGAPLSEELLFRGFLLSALAKTRLGFAGAALVSTTLWTALHAGYSVLGILEVFTIGLFFSWMLWRTGSLRVPIFCHALYNSLIVCMLRFVALPGGAIG
ncbi:MAG TPA: type II CAAX endopeptidase family protein [Hyphomicrobiaceae bacterium]|nr:type II CAAX endopeptidase family protein [Hyphomicrobiaceae bacterium]